MRLSSILTTVLGLAFVGGSVYAARSYIEGQQAQVEASAEAALVEVIVAARDIPLGQPIEPDMLTTLSWPRNAVPDGTFTAFADLVAAPGAEPRRARRAIDQGELILASRVSEFGEKVTIVETLSPGHRAIAIEVSAETAVGGFVTPGDAVDVVLTTRDQENLRAVTILQNIRVLGVDQQSDENSDEVVVARTVTLEVTPADGQRLALAQQAGTLSLTLRTAGVEGEDAEVLDAIELSDLLQVEAPAPVIAEGEIAPPPRVQEIVVRRGMDVAVEQVDP